MIYRFGEYSFNLQERVLIGGSSNNQAVAEKEAKVLHKLLSTEGIVTREELYADVWGTQYKSPDALNRVI